MKNRFDTAYSRGFWNGLWLGIGIFLLALVLFIRANPITPLTFASERGAIHDRR